MPRIDRRDLFKLIGAGGAGAGAGYLIATGTQPPIRRRGPENSSTGIGAWTRSSCALCSAGCGITVRTRAGRANKIEGNPDHPVNRGKLCALGQAGLQTLYNPDRIRGPMVRNGKRFSGSFEPSTWDTELANVGDALRDLRKTRKKNRVVFLSHGLHGHLGNLIELFMDEVRSKRILQTDFADPVALYSASRTLFDVDALPYYDIANSNFLISFGADFLGAWLSPVHFGAAFGESRAGLPGARGRFVQIEPRMSVSGAAADEWIAARPGSEGILALGLAHHIVASGRYRGGNRRAWSDALKGYSPATVAASTDVAASTIVRLAETFADEGPSLAIGGSAVSHTNDADSLVAVNALNHLVGNLNEPGGVMFNPKPVIGRGLRQRQTSYPAMLDFIEDARMGRIDVLIINGANPAFTLPAAAGFREALRGIPLIVSLSSFVDDTTALADVILPSHTYLESWGDGMPEPGMGRRVGTISRPVVTPLHDTRATGDIILAVSRRMGLKVPLPWDDMEQLLQDAWRRIYARSEAGDSMDSFEAFWNASVEAGVWSETGFLKRRSYAPSRKKIRRMSVSPPRFSGAEEDYPFMLHPYVSGSFRDGRGANLPWIQELPDPMTGVVYESWAEVNPTTAAKLGVTEGDVLRVESLYGWITAPALIYPAIRPDVIAMPIGQGHHDYGRYARNRGANPLRILAPEIDEATGGLATGATRIRLSRTGSRVRIVKPDDSRMLGAGVVQTVRADDLAPIEAEPT